MCERCERLMAGNVVRRHPACRWTQDGGGLTPQAEELLFWYEKAWQGLVGKSMTGRSR